MSSTLSESPATTVRSVGARARAALRARQQADIDLLVAAVEWAQAHPATEDDCAVWDGQPTTHEEGMVGLAGPGSPLVAEFAPAALAAELGWTRHAATELIADGLDLAHRLPGFWRAVQALRVPAWVARFAARSCRDLPLEAAFDLDRRLADHAATDPAYLSRRRITALVDEVRIYHDPERVVADEEHALASRHVESWQGHTPATTDVFMRLDTADAEALEKSVSSVAQRLGELGDTDALEIRRARAVGVLADPARALDLLSTDGALPERRTPAPPVTLWLHLSDQTLLDIDTHAGAVVSDRLGVLSTDLLRMWLTGSTVVVRPVLQKAAPVDRHDPPAAMADEVRLRDPICVFPACQRPSRACDLDHVEPYVSIDHGGPPGQTRVDNLAPLSRHHHRMKTHGGWTYVRHPDGSYAWTSPSDQRYCTPAHRQVL